MFVIPAPSSRAVGRTHRGRRVTPDAHHARTPAL